MPEPILAAQNTWWAPTNSSVTRASITEIEIMDSYTPTGTITDTWDASAAKDGSVTCYVIGTKLIIAGNGSGKVYANENPSSFFAVNTQDCFKNLVSIIGIGFFDTRYATTLEKLFFMCSSLEELDLRDFDTSNVTNIIRMFTSCSSIRKINMGGLDLSKITSLSFVFANAGNNLDIQGLDTCVLTNVTDMSYMFYGSSLKNVPMFDTSSVENMEYLFSRYRGTNITIPAWETANVKNMVEMFSRDSGTLVTNIDISNLKFNSVEQCYNMFLNGYGNDKLTNLNLGNFYFPKCTSIANAFKGCSALKTISFTNASFPLVTSFKALFQDCKALETFDAPNWNVSNVTDLSFMFYNCSSLGEIDVSNWDTSKVTNLDHFAAHANLKRIGMGNWNTSSLVNANAAFHNCAEEELDLSGWNVSKVQFFCQMFENSPNLKRIKGLDKWNTSAGLGFDGMFERCSKLEELDLSSFNTTKAKNNVSASTNGHKTATLNNMFLTCNNLEKVTVGPNWSVNGDGTNTTAANKAILPTPSSTYIAGADGYWYTFNGDQYAPNAMQDKTAATYYASFDMVADMDVIVKNGSLIDTAKAIREKNGTATQYTPSEFGAAIRALA